MLKRTTRWGADPNRGRRSYVLKRKPKPYTLTSHPDPKLLIPKS